MRLSLDDGDSDNHAGPSTSTEMRQTNLGSRNPLVARPDVYYGEGPFDPPSSDDEDEAEGGPHGSEDETEMLGLLSGPSSPGRAESGGQSPRRPAEVVQKHSSMRFLAIVLISLVSLSAVIGIIAGFTYSGQSYHIPGMRRITMDHLFNGTFWAHPVNLNWVAEAGDGVFSQISDGGHMQLVDLKTHTTTNLLATLDVKDEHGNPLAIWNWQLSDDMNYLLIKTDYRKQWRWSSYGNYYVHNIAEKTTHPIVPPSNPSKTAYATWSPTGNAIAYVTDNDLYILPSAEPNTPSIRVTTSGNASLFHGVPDWVYEEEIFSANFALWWSPDSSKVAFLAFDETAVPEFSFPVYNPTEDSGAVVPYTSEVTMKYPKPGYNNPLVSVHVFELDRYLERHGDVGFPAAEQTLTLDWDARHPVDFSVILEVAWVGNSSLIVKEVNRNADDGNVVLFDLDAVTMASRATGKVVRKLGKDGEEGDDGWIDNEQTIYPVPPGLTTIAGTDAYLDIVPTPEGYNHIALFSPANSDAPRFLTSGQWEVTGKIQGIDAKRGLVYFLAAKPSSTQRHLYSVPIPTISSEKIVEPTALTDATKPSYYSAKFSPEAGFYVLSYQGPGTPWHKVVQVNNATFEHVLDMNEQLIEAGNTYESAVVEHTTFTNDGYELNVKEIRPPRMDDSGRTKYPVLFRVYGGPHSQLVDLKYGREWHEYLACGLQYITVVVDGRGTGFKGRKLRNAVKGNLGFYETLDQIAAAKAWAKKPYVDPKRIGIWGWSYGGFMSSKVIEANAGIHSLAMAVAPVTSWRLYDSIYTERYMNLPDLNPGGYVNASISNVTGFRDVDFLLAHGSGDDNVHYANSAHLLDMFTRGKVRNFRFRMFTDSDHSINRRGAQREIYEYLTGFLIEKWGKGGRRRL
ncbi:dipeptidyl aminopeptidase [Crassisporium funariophilum]|nr:dipeptidyl aminopeptidase [Crassisporium funariophilum]